MFNFLKLKDKIIIRFNTKAPEGSKLVWRIFINDIEFLASHFTINGLVGSVLTYENNVQKYNVGCYGKVLWNGSKARVISFGRLKGL